MEKQTLPLPLFDNFEYFARQSCQEEEFSVDFTVAQLFLKAYDGSKATFNAYRREVERLLQWAHLIQKKSILILKREDIESYIAFCQNPPQQWIGIKKVPRFLNKEGFRIANKNWRPFVVTVSKALQKQQPISIGDYELSQSALRDIFAILSSFYQFLIQEEQIEYNPVQMIKQKSKFIRKKQGKDKIRRLSNTQWQYVLATTEQLANKKPHQHERTLFILSILFSLYLRISELAESARWAPTMNDFWQDQDGDWWFTTVGKGNKERQISVSDSMLDALKRWRVFLGLAPLPSVNDNSPLLPKLTGKGGITSTTYIRELVQLCFDLATDKLRSEGLTEDADNLSQATVHWLRHTGISEDVKHRPREHVRDDAGHSSSAITDRYIDIELKARHQSAKHKKIKE